MQVPSRIAVYVALALAMLTLPTLVPQVYAADNVAHVQRVTSSLVVVQGPAVRLFVPRMPVCIVEEEHGHPGLVLAEGFVVSISGDRATVEVNDKQITAIVDGALCEPRWQTEARLYKAGHLDMQGDSASKGAADKAKESAAVRARHRPPASVGWGKPLWLEALLEGPADRMVIMYRLGSAGPFAELPMQAKADNLFSISLPVGETDPSIRTVEYYLVALSTGTNNRVGVRGSPAEPEHVAIDSVPETPQETLVNHDPLDRGSQHKDLEITAEVNKRVSHPVLHYRARGSGAYLAVPMVVAGQDTWTATIPGRDVVAPGLAYYITVLDEKGVSREGFASSRGPQNVTVLLPQILSAEQNRNILGLRYQHVQFGYANDKYAEFGGMLERSFFGFMVARIDLGLLSGKALYVPKVGDTAGRYAVDTSLKRGRAGLDLHLGDYVSISGDLSMAVYSAAAAGMAASTGSGVGTRLGARVGDEQVATLDFSMEKIWSTAGDGKIVDWYRGALTVPVSESWRVSGAAVFESQMQQLSSSKGLRLLLGIECDLGGKVALRGHGGLASRVDAVQGADLGGDARVRF